MRASAATPQVFQPAQDWADRAPHSPMLGFVVGTGISLALWALITWAAWVLLA